MDLGRLREYKKSILITDKPINQVDSITGEKLNRIYMRVMFEPKFKTTQEPDEYFFNQDSTPDSLKNHWDNFLEKRRLAVENIKTKMKRYFIQKNEIK